MNVICVQMEWELQYCTCAQKNSELFVSRCHKYFLCPDGMTIICVQTSWEGFVSNRNESYLCPGEMRVICFQMKESSLMCKWNESCFYPDVIRVFVNVQTNEYYSNESYLCEHGMRFFVSKWNECYLCPYIMNVICIQLYWVLVVSRRSESYLCSAAACFPRWPWRPP
jgi:hypothetical protein